jgi:hypothetical protein
MRSPKPERADLSILGGLVLALALTSGSPFAGTKSVSAQDNGRPQQSQQHPDQEQANATTFTGIIVKNGANYVLRDSSGALYKLDDPERAKHFEGKSVKITGELDQQVDVIHVESIEGTEA